MTKLVDLLDQLKHRRTFGFMDDFDSYTSGQRLDERHQQFRRRVGS